MRMLINVDWVPAWLAISLRRMVEKGGRDVARCARLDEKGCDCMG